MGKQTTLVQVGTTEWRERSCLSAALFARGAAVCAIVLLSLACGDDPTEPSLTPTPVPTPTVQPPGRTLTVTSTADSGPGTLRQALLDSRTGDTITFDAVVFPPTEPATIYLANTLPAINQNNLTIDGSNAGVVLDGSTMSEGTVPGLEVASKGNTIHGLQIRSFSGAGILLIDGAKDNTIGGDRNVGAGPVGQGNLTNGNATGICLIGHGTSSNTIKGNLVGTDSSGAADSGNQTGIYVSEGASGNTIGPDNVIAFNNEEGIQVYDSTSLGNTIAQNSIHGNALMGIFLNRGGNTELAAPVIGDFDLETGHVAGVACAKCRVEIFSDREDEGGVYEGRTTADGLGGFTFDKDASLTGPHLTVTATDVDGNTSEFSVPTSGKRRSVALQEGNALSKSRLLTRPSSQLIADVRLGASMYSSNIWGDIPHLDSILKDLTDMGIGRLDTSMQEVEEPIDWNRPEYEVPEEYDRFVDGLNESGVVVNYLLHFWDKAGHVSGKQLSTPRFKTEEQIQDFLEYVRFVVSHFQGRVQYYTIWTEPDNCMYPQIKCIEPNDYINLVSKTVPVIRQEDPEAKVALAPVFPFFAREQLFAIVTSDVIPMFDVIQWHGIYDVVPNSDFFGNYYYEYPAIIDQIKETASAHGFDGEFWGTELTYCSEEFADRHPPDQPWGIEKTERLAAKYLARVFVTQLGMDVGVSTGTLVGTEPWTYPTIRNLYAVMAGTKPIALALEVDSTATNIKSYGFSISNADRLLVLWTDGVAVDDDPGVKSTLTVKGFSGKNVTGIDVLYGFEQKLTAESQGGDLVIRNLLVKDYPIILRLTE